MASKFVALQPYFRAFMMRYRLPTNKLFDLISSPNNLFKILMLCFCCSVPMVGLFSSCISEEDYLTERTAKLTFSTDTLTFDTVFTTMGSITKELCIHNPHDKPILLDQVFLGGGRQSPYRLNVDGDTNMVACGIEILPHDSIFVFVRVTIDPTNQSNPLLVRDSIVFAFNGKRQYLQLVAFGQDAYYHFPDYSSNHYFRSYNSKGREIRYYYSIVNEKAALRGCEESGNMLRWKNDKPHVVFDICVVDSAQVLTLPEGTEVYMANRSQFWVYTDGTLKMKGEEGKPVIMQSLRKDGYYRSLPGQWERLWLMAGSRNNEIEHAIIKNGGVGIMVDTCVNAHPTVSLKNVEIANMSENGIWARGAKIEGVNVVVKNIGKSAVNLELGGKYRFIHCTFANYWAFQTRKFPTLRLQNYYKYSDQIVYERPMEMAEFHNCIVYGSHTKKEIEIDETYFLLPQYVFDHCLLAIPQQFDTAHFSHCLFDQDPLFVNTSDHDLHLLDASPAKGKSHVQWTQSHAQKDFDGVLRINPAAIGAYEYVKPKTK